jgi:hypothetical protein
MISSRRWWIFVLLVLMLVTIGIGWQQGSAQAENERYFPETGHWVTDEFLLKYEELPNPSEIYGAPITERFNDPINGREIQYFEKARFEFHPELPASLQVKLSTLGQYLYQEGQPIAVLANAPACRTFIESPHPVCYAFLDFFEDNGDTAQFGYPVSGFEIQDGLIIQYFQTARFEWHPENPAGRHVTVSNLGYRYFYERREDPTLLNAVPNEDAPDLPVIRLVPYAFAGSAILPLSGSQTLYLVVQDQNHQPVEDAEVEFTVVLPDGSTKEYKANNTNTEGVSVLSFEVRSSSPGIANIAVVVSYDNQALQAKTRTSFSIWW